MFFKIHTSILFFFSDAQVRATGQHVLYEHSKWQTAFLLDHEIMLLCQTLTDGLKYQLKDLSDGATVVKECSQKLELCGVALMNWYRKIGLISACPDIETALSSSFSVGSGYASFHIPLHRFYAMIVYEGMSSIPEGKAMSKL